MTPMNLPYEEVDRMNLAALERAADDIEALEYGLTIPVKDLALFFARIPGKHMLDIGCGWGRYSHYFIQAGLSYQGIDYSPAMVKVAQKFNPTLSFREMDFHELDYPSETFDGLWGCCIFGGEPKSRLPTAVEEMLRVLKPGGILLLIIPNEGFSEEVIHDQDPRYGPIYSSAWHSLEFADALKDLEFSEMELIHRNECGSATFIYTK